MSPYQYGPSLSAHRLTQFPSGSQAGGDEGIRTLDPLLAGQVLSQLSYTPIFLLPFELGVLREP